MKNLFIFTLLAACFLTSIQAQTSPPITVALQTLGLGVEHSDLFIQQGEKYETLKVDFDALSYKIVTYTGPQTMLLFRKVQTAKGLAYTTVGEVKFPAILPDQSNEFVLFFVPGPATKMSVGIFRNDKVSFPADSVRVINVMRVPTGVKVNQTVGILQPGESKVLAMGSDANKAEIHIAVAKGDRWIEVCNNVFPLAEEYRRTIFVLDVTTDGPSVRKIPQITLLTMAEAKIKPPPQTDAVAAGSAP